MQSTIALASMALFGLIHVTPAMAQSLPAPNDAEKNVTILHLSETAQRDVPRDRLRVDLAAEATDADATKVQAEINRRMNAAIARIKAQPDVALETNGYSVYQDRPDKGPARWQGSQSISLNAADFAKLLTLVGNLQQDGLVVRGLAPELSRAARQSVEDELTETALTRLRQRAERIAATFGAKISRFRRVTVGNAAVPPVPMRAMAVAAAPVMQAPVAEPGEAPVSVSVEADIALAASP